MESENRRERRNHRSLMRSNAPWYVWLGVGVLIILLLVWLSIAMFTGDTDVDFIALPSLLF